MHGHTELLVKNSAVTLYADWSPDLHGKSELPLQVKKAAGQVSC